jgi:hypothetical protein
MKSFDFGRYAFSATIAAALLAGCGGSQPPIGGTGTMPQGRAFATHAARGVSWILPEAKSRDLLYAATGDNVYVLAYPSGKLMGSLNVSGSNICSDQNGNVFIPTNGYVILEYAHGDKYPIQTLHGGDIPLGCAVDPTTGNLAVTQEASGAGEVAIFPNAKEPATWYQDSDIYTYGLCGYDNRGNLFVDGNGTGNYIAELPKGGSTFKNYALGDNFDTFGSIQRDGRDLIFSSATTHQVVRLSFRKSSFKVLRTTQITGWQNNYSGHWPYVQTWLQGHAFIAQSSSLAVLGLWRYPAGGKALKTLGPFKSGNVSIYGVAVSLPPSRRL